MKAQVSKNGGTKTGMNRTGIALSPIDSKELIQGALATQPSMEGNDETANVMRIEYGKAAEPIGTVPPPTTMKGAAGTVVKAVKGENMSAFLDKLGARLAFERAGTRLYAALITKHKSSPPLPGGPTLEQLQEIEADEHAHFQMLVEAVKSLGGDPTVVTPAADVSAVASMGLPQVLADPRTTMLQCLEAILMAELIDNECWTVLAELAERLGHKELAENFRAALAEEEKHLLLARSWVTEATLRDGGAVH